MLLAMLAAAAALPSVAQLSGAHFHDAEVVKRLRAGEYDPRDYPDFHPIAAHFPAAGKLELDLALSLRAEGTAELDGKLQPARVAPCLAEEKRYRRPGRKPRFACVRLEGKRALLAAPDGALVEGTLNWFEFETGDEARTFRRSPP